MELHLGCLKNSFPCFSSPHSMLGSVGRLTVAGLCMFVGGTDESHVCIQG